MSQKWQRSKQWDDQHIPPALWPLKKLLRAFSSITLAVFLLSGVVIYAILASVPIGLLALIPTYLIYALSLVVTVVLIAGVPAFGLASITRRAPRGARFLILFLSVTGLSILGAWLWSAYLWPVLHYDAAHGTGFRLFVSFADQYKATTLRRLPALEMSELEFYSWWPMRALLLAFVANMVTATLRRIEFSFPYIGVLTVHTGIVTMALGAIYYKGLKKEGDTLLMAGRPAANGAPTPGPPQDIFYDNTDVALWLDMGRGWEARPLRRIPRYNDYALDTADAASGPTVSSALGAAHPATDAGRTLTLSVPDSPKLIIDPDIDFRIVGYASYAEPVEDWAQAAAPAVGPANPARFVELISHLPDERGQVSSKPAYVFSFLPEIPAERTSDNELGVLGIEYTRPMPDDRWADLLAELPEGAEHALVVEVPGADYSDVYPVTQGAEIAVGETGYKLSIQELAKQPPFPIITPGYRGATSSVAIVRVTPPSGPAFERWTYHRFPEIDQDMLDEVNERGMPTRRAPDPAIRIRYLDCSQIQIYLDERSDGSVRTIIRGRGGPARLIDRTEPGGVIPILDKIDLRLADRWDHAERVERPHVVPEQERDKSMIGTHDHAMLAVQVSARSGPARVIWLPFTKYVNVGMGTERSLTLNDGRTLHLAFGRYAHQLPGFAIQLADFQMIAYDHRGAPRDYQSIVRVAPTSLNFETYEHVTKLNAPLQAPFLWSDTRPWISNAIGRFASRLNPNQFKFSQAGWDAEGWRQTQAAADRGEIPRPFVNFTILGVGNNPGIHIIALGGIMVAVGTPWAFYVKPWIMRRRKKKIQDQLVRERAANNDPVGARA